MPAARVSRINVTPVKSFRLHHPDALWLGRHGAAEDRRFLLVDDGRRLYNGNRDPVLVRAHAIWNPDSRALRMTVPGADALEAVALRGSRTVVEVYGRQVRGHVVEGPWAGALSDLVGRSLTLVEREDRAWGTDVRPVTLISQASLGLIDGDGRRFRMLLEVDGLDSLEEETWRNRRLRVGEATLFVGAPTPRCATPSADPDTGRRDRDALRELIVARSAVEGRGAVDGQACLGVYAEVLEPGLVRVGDTVEPGAAAGRSPTYVVDRVRISARRLAKLRQLTVR
jgi:uncharacterized protein YcbX